MKKILHILLFITITLFSFDLGAQRFLTEVFTNVTTTSNVVYGLNISVLTGVPAADTLKMDIYEPSTDTMSERPVVLVFPTGNFLPAVLNGGPNGQRTDSAVVEVCTKLAKRGFVAAAVSYRTGWNPVSPDQNVRTSTLINAAYRGMQDAHNAVRFFNMGYQNLGNPFGIDTSRVIIGGIGTGGYVSYVMMYFDKNKDMMIPKFFNFDSVPPQPYVDTLLSGNYSGTVQAPLNVPNLPTFSSNVHFGFAMGGAIGDSGWVDPKNTTPFVAFQNPLDIFAPYKTGSVIVPTTGDFVVEASGAYTVLRKVTEFNLNKSFSDLRIKDDISLYANSINDGYDGLYPLITPIPTDSLSCTGPNSHAKYPNQNPWDWYNETWYIAAANSLGQPGPVMNCLAKLGNPNDPVQSRKYIDTIMSYLVPRIVCSLGLPQCALVPKNPIGIEEYAKKTLAIYPNPSYSDITIQNIDSENPIEQIQLIDITGKIVRLEKQLNTTNYVIQKGNLSPGIYLLKITLKEGNVSRKIVFN
jgi:Secretion system C-terminal sorting domain